MQTTGALTLADAVFPRLKTDSRAMSVARDVALMVGFALFVAVCAQIAVRLPWTTVPITGQTFGTLVTGGALGWKRGAGALSIYMVAGFFLPFYAPGNGVTQGAWDVHFILPLAGTHNFVWNLSSGGYIVGFILAAAVVGYLCEKKQWDRKPWVYVAMLLGNIALYIPGILWLAYLIAKPLMIAGKPLGAYMLNFKGEPVVGLWNQALWGGLYPFIVGDLTKLFLASLTLPAAWALVQRFKKAQK